MSDKGNGYAFWARSDWGRLMLSGECPNDISQIGEAEIYAICQGMYKSLNKWKEKEIKGFYIFSDSKEAISRLKNPATTKGTDVKIRLKTAYDKLVVENSLENVIKHVKGHTGKTKLTKYWLNDWCDKNSKKASKKKKNDT